MGNVDHWLVSGGGNGLSPADLPFPETRAYVRKVLHARSEYRHAYPRELGY